jgi:hypothetical protein
VAPGLTTFPGKNELIAAELAGGTGLPPEHAHALWQHWGEPAIWSFSGSHTAPFGRSQIMVRAAAHLKGLGLLPDRRV